MGFFMLFLLVVLIQTSYALKEALDRREDAAVGSADDGPCFCKICSQCITACCMECRVEDPAQCFAQCGKGKCFAQCQKQPQCLACKQCNKKNAVLLLISVNNVKMMK